MIGLLLALSLATPVAPVNAVAGDRSWIEAHGSAPDASTPERERIATHLLWIERRLRARDSSGLLPSQRDARARLLDALHAYALAGAFPRHEAAVGGRRPRFVDEEGRHCAVAALIRESGGSALVEAIRAAHELDYVRDMREPMLAAWASDHGFTTRELAEIQPTYDDRPSVDVPHLPVDDVLRRGEAWRRIVPAPFTQAHLDRIVSEIDRRAIARSCLAGRRGQWSAHADLRIETDLTAHVAVTLTRADGSEPEPRLARCVERAIGWLFRRTVMRRRYEPGSSAHASYDALLEGLFHG